MDRWTKWQQAQYEAWKRAQGFRADTHLNIGVRYDPANADNTLVTVVENGTMHGILINRHVRCVLFKGQEVYKR